MNWRVATEYLAVAFLCCACGPGASSPSSDRGRASDLKDMRIVSMAPNLTEILFELGLEEQIVGVSNFCDYPPAAATKQRVGGVINADIEAIVALEPDLVVNIPGTTSRETVVRLENLGVHTVVVGARTIEETFAAIDTLGKLTGREQRAADLVNSMRIELDNVRTRAQIEPRKNTLFVIGHNPLRVAAGNTFIDDLIEIAGGINVVKDALGRYPRIGLEEVIARQPEIIIDSTLGTAFSEKDIAARRAWWEQWSAIPAVKTGRIYGLDTDVLLRPGPRMTDAALMVAQVIHPEIFGGDND